MCYTTIGNVFNMVRLVFGLRPFTASAYVSQFFKKGYKHMNDNCIFCKIINGSIPSSKVYEDDNFLSILDISPSSKGHAVLFPKTHCQNLFDADEQLLKTLLPTARKIASAIKSTVNCDGINLLQNNEPAAGQTIYHLHMHIIPRYENDGCTIKWEKVSYEENEAPALAKQIADRIF